MTEAVEMLKKKLKNNTDEKTTSIDFLRKLDRENMKETVAHQMSQFLKLRTLSNQEFKYEVPTEVEEELNQVASNLEDSEPALLKVRDPNVKIKQADAVKAELRARIQMGQVNKKTAKVLRDMVRICLIGCRNDDAPEKYVDSIEWMYDNYHNEVQYILHTLTLSLYRLIEFFKTQIKIYDKTWKPKFFPPTLHESIYAEGIEDVFFELQHQQRTKDELELFLNDKIAGDYATTRQETLVKKMKFDLTDCLKRFKKLKECLDKFRLQYAEAIKTCSAKRAESLKNPPIVTTTENDLPLRCIMRTEIPKSKILAIQRSSHFPRPMLLNDVASTPARERDTESVVQRIEQFRKAYKDRKQPRPKKINEYLDANIPHSLANITHLEIGGSRRKKKRRKTRRRR